MGHFGVSFLELLILFEQWAGHRLLGEKVTRPHVRAGRPISVSSVSVSEGIEIRHGCQFISSLVRVLGKLSGGLGRFLVTCSTGTFARVVPRGPLLTARPLLVRGGRGRRRGSAGLLGLLDTPLVAAVIVDNGSGMSMAGFAVVVFLTL